MPWTLLEGVRKTTQVYFNPRIVFWDCLVRDSVLLSDSIAEEHVLVRPEWFTFMGHEAGSYEPGSPFAINFRTDVKEATSVEPLSSPVAACSDPSLACSCGDCPGASSCAEPNPPAPPEYRGCSVQIAGLQVLV